MKQIAILHSIDPERLAKTVNSCIASGINEPDLTFSITFKEDPTTGRAHPLYVVCLQYEAIEHNPAN